MNRNHVRGDSETHREAALLVRPLPSAAWTGQEPIRFGGGPRLPDGMDWPRRPWGTPDHFIAEIDLARLARSLEMAGEPLAAPDFPDHGTVFIFLPLHNDGIYNLDTGLVLDTPEDVSALPERDPPDDLPSVFESDPCHVHEDGTTHDGRLLVRRRAAAIPFASTFAPRPAFDGSDPEDAFETWKRANAANARACDRAFRSVGRMAVNPLRPAAPGPAGSAELGARIPAAFTQYRFPGHHLDWEFIFDWSKKFLRGCCKLTLGELEGIGGGLFTRWRQRNFLRRLEEHHRGLKARRYGKGDPAGAGEAPLAVAEAFDRQAERWLALSQGAPGRPDPDLLQAFIAMLTELAGHFDRKDAQGHRTGSLRVAMFEERLRGHDRGAADLRTMAKEAFRYAAGRAAERHAPAPADLPQDVRWDGRLFEAEQRWLGGTPGAVTPHQMFGQGTDIQGEVAARAGDVLLFQFGEDHGLPLLTGHEVVVHLWIDPDALAIGDFGRVEMTLGMS